MDIMSGSDHEVCGDAADIKKVNIEPDLTIAFLQGAKYWEYHRTGATMWQSDQHEVMEEAIRRRERGTLGR